jgi:hypothetical protein
MLKPAAAILTAILLRFWIIWRFPIVFGGDSMVRLVNHDHILLSYQLPLLQLLVWATTHGVAGTAMARVMMAVLGALATLAFYSLAAEFVPPWAALAGAVLFATQPYIAPISTVPYQEILLLGALLAAFHCFFRRRWVWSAVFLGAACLTRFEAWIACPILAIDWFLEDSRTVRRAAQAVALFCPVPIAWILFRHGLSPGGSFVLDRSLSFARLFRPWYLAAYTIRETPVPVLILAAAGLFIGIRDCLTRGIDRRAAILTIFLLLFTFAILFSAHGELPDPERYVTTREIHIPLVGVILLATFACARFPRAAMPLAVAGFVMGVWGSVQYVRHETERPEIRAGYELAQYLDAHVLDGEQVLVLAEPPPLDLYLRRAQETGSEAGLAAARRALEQVEMLPLDAQRTVIHLGRLSRSQVFVYPKIPPHPAWIAAWSDFSGGAVWAIRARERPDAILQTGNRSIAIRRIRDVY